MIKAYRASAKDGSAITKESPRAAALAFFERFPDKRKCNVTEGEIDGAFFVVKIGRLSNPSWPSRWENVTKKTAPGLPESEPV
jgi:hypothetical protein